MSALSVWASRSSAQVSRPLRGSISTRASYLPHPFSTRVACPELSSSSACAWSRTKRKTASLSGGKRTASSVHGAQKGGLGRLHDRPTCAGALRAGCAEVDVQACRITPAGGQKRAEDSKCQCKCAVASQYLAVRELMRAVAIVVFATRTVEWLLLFPPGYWKGWGHIPRVRHKWARRPPPAAPASSACG